MSQFTTPLKVELIGNNLWQIIEGFEYHVGSYPSKEIIKVPEGFVTDFASVPRIFWFSISPVDTHAKAAVIHDYCYKIAYADKDRCDDIFYEGLCVLEVPDWKRNVMYYAVKYFGQSAWDEHRKNARTK